MSKLLLIQIDISMKWSKISSLNNDFHICLIKIIIKIIKARERNNQAA